MNYWEFADVLSNRHGRDAWLRYVDTDIALTKHLVKENEKNMDERRLMNAQYGVASTYKPKKVIYDEAAGVTVVLWMDGTKTIVRAAEGEEHDAYLGYCIALAKKMHGTNSALKRDLEKVLVVKEDKKLNIPLPTMNGLADKLVEVMQKFNNATTKEE